MEPDEELNQRDVISNPPLKTTMMISVFSNGIIIVMLPCWTKLPLELQNQ